MVINKLTTEAVTVVFKKCGKKRKIRGNTIIDTIRVEKTVPTGNNRHCGNRFVKTLVEATRRCKVIRNSCKSVTVQYTSLVRLFYRCI